MSLQRNKVYRVRTIALVAAEIGEDEERLHEIAEGMDTEDGVIWVYDTDERHTLAFTDFGVETLADLIADLRRSPS